MPMPSSAMVSSSRQNKPRRRLPWWLAFWPPHVARAVAQASGIGDEVEGLEHVGAVPAYGGGPGASYGSLAQVTDRPNTSVREWVLGFGITVVPEGATVAITARPQVIFRPERFFIPSVITLAGGIGVVDIKVGNRSQLVNTAMLPGQLFDENAVGLRLSCDTAQIAQDVTMVIKDLSGVGGTFVGAAVGTAVL